MKEKDISIQGEPVSASPLTFDAKLCNGCNLCVDVCQVDILIPNPEKGRPPIVLYPGECWYGGCCVAICPKPGAIRLNTSKMNQVNWKLK